MSGKVKFLLCLILFVSCIFSVHAQNDTVYVYEDVVVYDTVLVYDTVFVKPEIQTIAPIKQKQINLIHFDTTNNTANIFSISGEETATFLMNRIILNENELTNNQNSVSMKKISFFGVVLFAFQTMVLAQTSYEFSLGSGMWWESSNLQYVDKPYSPSISIGLFAKRNFGVSDFGLKTGLEYSYLISTGKYEYDGTPGVWYSPEGYEYEDLNNNYGSGFHSLSVPVLFYYNRFKIQPFAGVNYNYMLSGVQNSSTGTTYVSDSHNFGINAGIAFTVSKKFAVNVEYKYNLTCDYKEAIYQELTNGSLVDESRHFRNNQMRVSLVYHFNKQ